MASVAAQVRALSAGSASEETLMSAAKANVINSPAPVSDVSIIIPTHNAGAFASRQVEEIRRQSLRPARVIVIDSQSSDGSQQVYRDAGFRVLSIRQSDFDHGGTRNFGARYCDSAILVYLTQDAILHNADSLANICAPFADPKVAVVYGRQLPRRGAGPIEQHARHFNYPATHAERTWQDAQAQGIRAIFNSNSFSAYRSQAFKQFGQFPERIIMGEDQVAAGRALLDGWTVVYAGEAVVEHSHGYSMWAEFRRYFDIGAFHNHHQVLFKQLLRTNNEGRRFVKSEINFLLHRAPLRIPEACIRTGLKLTGYHLGKREGLLPALLKRYCAMNAGFFTKPVEHNAREETQVITP